MATEQFFGKSMEWEDSTEVLEYGGLHFAVARFVETGLTPP